MAPDSQHTTETRERLLLTAVTEFGRRDYDGVAIRQIIEAAGVNIAAVSYHFGGKRGLYLATVEYLAERLHTEMAEHQTQVRLALDTADSSACADRLCEFTAIFVEVLLNGELGESAPGIIFREQHQPTDAYDILYQKLLQPLHATLTDLIACHRGERHASRSSLILAHTLLGQCVIFRMGRTTLLRRLDQPEYTRTDIDELKLHLSSYCRCLLEAPVDSEELS